jgi:5-(carboxyamino)imidazole ribonucleotide synthase
MVNLMGDDAGTGLQRVGTLEMMAVPTAALHLYGKAESRPGRKMGHVTTLGDDADQALERARRAWDALAGEVDAVALAPARE